MHKQIVSARLTLYGSLGRDRAFMLFLADFLGIGGTVKRLNKCVQLLIKTALFLELGFFQLEAG
jgi:hypothetical protein